MVVDDLTLHLPRILCLHGGGANADVFHAQCRSLRYHLNSKFRLCFVDAPFLCDAGPGLLPVYEDYGPFRRWLRWQPQHPEVNADTGIHEIDYSLRTAMEADDRKGATGEWVGLMGFSQGATVSASLLLRQQARSEKLGADKSGTNFRFAILMAGRAPLVTLDPSLLSSPALLDPSQPSDGFDRFPAPSSSQSGAGGNEDEEDHVLRLPTVHVHGLRDPGLPFHRQLLEQYCAKGSTRLVTWDGEHRVPIKTHDVDPVVKQILEVAKQTGAVLE